MNSCASLSAIGFFLISMTAEGFCELIILRHPPSEDGRSRDLTCITEDDGSAVVWNYDYKANVSYSGKHGEIGFQPKKEEIGESFPYVSKWKSDNWSKTKKWDKVESAACSIGPVFDHRWEAFDKFPLNGNITSPKYQLVKLIEGDHGTAIFSARGIQDINILLCQSAGPMRSFCFSILIGSSGGQQSKIQSCEAGQLRTGKSCKDLHTASHESPIIDLYDWRTFRIELSYQKTEIKVFEGSKNEPFLNGSINSWKGQGYVYVNSKTSSRVRFHFYQYHRTNVESILYSDFFTPESKDLSVQVMVALCSSCELEISLTYSTGESFGKITIHGDENSAWKDYPSWQLIDYNTTLPDLKKNMRLELGSKIASTHILGEGLWAVGDYRIRKTFGELRTSTITIHRESEREIWPKVTCQKLSYSGTFRVDLPSENRIDDRGIQFQRLINSWEKSYSSSDMFFGEGGSICNQMGCQCARGFRGSDCSEKCSAARMHVDCVTVCESENFLPPLCKIEFRRPFVRRLLDSSVDIFENVELEAEAQIRFDIFQGGAYRPSLSVKADKTQKLWYEAHIIELRPLTEFTVHAVISVPTAKGVSEFESPSNQFRTNAFSKIDNTDKLRVSVMLGENNIILNMDLKLKKSQLLVDSPSLIITDSNGTYIRESISKTDYEIKNLRSYTEYKLAIYDGGNRELWAEPVRTLGSAPGEISSLRHTSLTDTEVTFEWDAPAEKNGIIRKYTVTIKIITLIGCLNLGRPTPEQEGISIVVKREKAVFKHLHPYAQYEVAVKAHTFEPGPEKFYSFQTEESKILTAKVSKLRLGNKNRSIEWDDPEDCTEITGLIRNTKLYFSPYDEPQNVQERTVGHPTTSLDLITLDLKPCTEYKVLVLVEGDPIKANNSEYYQEFKWMTPSIAPNSPVNLTASSEPQGIVRLEWSYPEISCRRIVQFEIQVALDQTKLLNLDAQFPKNVEYLVQNKDQKKYNTTIHLWPSTSYRIDVTSVDDQNERSRSAHRNIQFEDGVRLNRGDGLQITTTGTSINLKIPRVINPTQNTTVTVQVTGTLTCVKKSSKPEIQLPPTTKEWIAAEYKPAEHQPTCLTIGAAHNQSAGMNSDCSLHFEETYNISVTLNDSSFGYPIKIGSLSIHLTGDKKVNLVWLIIPPIIVIISIVILLIRRNANRKRVPTPPRRPSYLEFIPLSPFPTPANSLATLDRSKKLTFFHQSGAGRKLSSNSAYSQPREADSCCVSVPYFAKYLKKAVASGLLYSQFMLLRRGLTSPCEYGRLPENMPKNRCGNLITYDETRVVLDQIPGDPHSDYINASYMRGFDKERAYIAAQGPIPNTVIDFWRMIWQEKVHVICMLTNVVEGAETKCEKYWPDPGIKVEYGDLVVSNVDVQVVADFTSRTFEVSYGPDKRKVIHLHHTGWSSLEVPADPRTLVPYLRKLRQTPSGNAPILVHCSTGDDRTGVIILCDICLDQAVAKMEIDVTATITKMRIDRANMVGTLQQYMLAHIIIMEMVSSPTQISFNKTLAFDVQHKPYDDNGRTQAARSLSTPKSFFLKAGTRAEVSYSHLQGPEAVYMNLLESKPNQFNAVSVDGPRMKNQYLTSWLPTPLTLTDFWEFVAKKNIKLIIILQCSDPLNATCCDIIPNGSTAVPSFEISVDTETSLVTEEYFTNEELLLTDTSKGTARVQSLTVVTCKGWACGENGKPPSPAALISLCLSCEQSVQIPGKTLILCHDGITGCRLYLALSSLMARMTASEDCDIISAVQAVHQSEPESVQVEEQFQYLCDAAALFAEYLQT